MSQVRHLLGMGLYACARRCRKNHDMDSDLNALAGVFVINVASI